MSTAPPPSAPVVGGRDGSASSLTAVDLAAAQAAMIEASTRAQLVVGTRGHGGFTGLRLGSVSQAVLHHAACPVVIVPPPRTGT